MTEQLPKGCAHHDWIAIRMSELQGHPPIRSATDLGGEQETVTDVRPLAAIEVSAFSHGSEP